ncbi:MAG: hypothetical protein M1826_006393 [Phylliscum demangeonii]|nr:MAG: hypothetical protein M1826_006393 [Phylliscum demangeonii]
MFRNRLLFAFRAPPASNRALTPDVRRAVSRANAQKPADDFYASFRQCFPEVGAGTAPPIHPRAASLSAASVDNASRPDPIRPRTMNADRDRDEIDPHDPTPRGTHDSWRFTPSFLDPHSFAFASLANQPPGYYPPTPGGSDPLYPRPAGDLHSPSMAIGLGTPLSLPTSAGGVPVEAAVDLDAFARPSAHASPFQTFHPFAAPTAFAPSTFHAPEAALGAPFASMDPAHAVAPVRAPAPAPRAPVSAAPETEMREASPSMGFVAALATTMAAPAALRPAEPFRFHVTLNAPTAMIRSADEIPITYLNKGQAYAMTIIDTAPPAAPLARTTYRTVVRISFEDEQQRQRPAACWQLWKEGRGLHEAHQRGGKLQAVEYVDPAACGDEESTPSGVEVESSSFDGFAVRWTAAAGASAADCAIAVRFNFLSTDFSHSKGVKGIPVRLCAKTEAITTPASPTTPAPTSEVCFGKVKLFRDHGAERKLSNDVAHVKKTIDKLQQQIAQVESGLKEAGKRKRTGSGLAKTAAPASAKPGKVPKHKRTWSMSSTGSAGPRAPAEEDLHLKLATMQDMFTSTRPVSVLDLPGHAQDDPDRHPVHLPPDAGDLSRLDARDELWDRRPSVAASTTAPSNLVSPASSTSGHGFRGPPGLRSPRLSHGGGDWTLFQAISPANLQASNPQLLASPPDEPIRVPKTETDDRGELSGWIEALEVNASYRPPSERPARPVACFYILPTDPGGGRRPERYYRAVYLMQRTAEHLVRGIAAKLHVEPRRIQRVVHRRRNGLTVLVDDDVVRELAEGQDMLVEASDLHAAAAPAPRLARDREWNSGPDDIQVDGDGASPVEASSSDLELTLVF